MKRLILRTILLALTPMLRNAAKKPALAREMARFNCVVQVKLMDQSIARHYVFQGGRVSGRTGLHSAPDVVIAFKDIETALALLNPDPDMAEVVHCAKNFKVVMTGRSELQVWFSQLVNKINNARLQMGVPQPDGTVRLTTVTNGGPLFVYVRNGKIVRVTPIDFDKSDPPSWTIKARGKSFTPLRRGTVAPHAMAIKSVVYSDKRILHPMKRVDFDPDGARNPQSRGISGYERISWDEALDIVAKEIVRQKRVHGPGSIFIPMSSHHQWGNVGYYLSALMRFGNLIGFTRMAANPDSWEGWYWGAQHHYGNSMRVGISGNYGTVEDCLKETDLIVFWSSDPESTNGAYMGFEGTQRRLWAKQLGIEFVHIDPHFNATAQLLGGKWFPIRPTTDPALALAIMYVWVMEGTYDKDYVARNTTGFDEWRDYLLGTSDGAPKTPEWQEDETGLPAKDVRALARKWASRKTYLSPGTGGSGFGGACRGATGAQWARSMILMMAMQGWGKPGVNMGNLQAGTPVDLAFYFPGYADGGISGDLQWTANAVNNYQRMPHVLTMNPVRQMIPRQQFPDAILNGQASGYLWDGSASEVQFAPFTYPMPGYSPIHMIYRYGGSFFSTLTDSSRMIEAYRHESIEFIVNQSIFLEGEVQFADVILPACTSLERYDIGEWGSGGGYLPHGFNALNHRVIALQHKCVEPLGESKSDYQIFTEILNRLGLGAMFTEGCTELDWCKRVFKSSDVAKHISWKQFCKKGYFVVPAERDEMREAVNMRWFAEGRPKDVPEAMPLPSQYAKEFGKGLSTPSGKIEFLPEILKRADPNNAERPVLNKYIAAWEGPRNVELAKKFPLQMIATHSRYSFHTSADGKNSFINDLAEHRTMVDGHYYWIVRLSAEDARSRGVDRGDLVKVFNERGAVICAADVSPMVARGVVKSYESSAEYQPRVIDGETVDIGGCMNLLTSSRSQMKGTSSMSPNSCLVEIKKWAGRAA
ncbi:pyrogallol hydroxytransferase large subunit [Rhodoblastus sphagnicola]|uniref:Pyrogallol hydroxytransferase large subunit n=1 Tax=Rhodoblastus sphagnicola TaxID=333368 RepID=A0A2S6N439_9HYPH|nr:molybdopterin-dependent oxidoreductase [Rhodoblastus sphagnicola]MBB4199850.1 trimethylamine-N-oxide reductase (cytochrome c) [Rhodoblastus sphagnicola]PPQ29369.1 pyrogallol hydroxytransferase large subunit [Rhodoblastus sphagnicola]